MRSRVDFVFCSTLRCFSEVWDFFFQTIVAVLLFIKEIKPLELQKLNLSGVILEVFNL